MVCVEKDVELLAPLDSALVGAWERGCRAVQGHTEEEEEEDEEEEEEEEDEEEEEEEEALKV